MMRCSSLAIIGNVADCERNDRADDRKESALGKRKSPLGQLESELTATKKSAYAPGTIRNLRSQFKLYLGFCQKFGFNWKIPTGTIIALFAQSLSTKLKSPQSIRNYIGGIKTIFSILGFSLLPFDSFHVALTFKGLARIKQFTPKQARPITLNMLLKFHECLDLNNPLDAMVWCLFLFAFFGMLRKSNLVVTSGINNPHVLRKRNVRIYPHCVILNIRSSKTNQNATRVHQVTLSKLNNSVLCPLQAYTNLTTLIPIARNDYIFSYHKNGKVHPFTYKQFQLALKFLLGRISIGHKGFSSHSFRRGGATLAFQSAVPSELIKFHGDWASSAYLRYLEFSDNQKLSITQKMQQMKKYN